MFEHTIDIENGAPKIPTTDYCNIRIGEYPQMLVGYSKKNKQMLARILDGNVDHKKARENGSTSINTIYPEDSRGEVNKDTSKNGVLRTEELVTFSSVNSETGEINYMVRSRPQMQHTNTPGKLDPGVVSHGGLTQAGVVNAWRYVADKLGKDDNQLTEEEYIRYIKDNPFPEEYSITDAGSFIIANGSNSRNAKKDIQDYEQRTSGLLTVRSVNLQVKDFQSIIDSQNNGKNPTEYGVVSLSEETDIQDFTPKHQAVHSLLTDISDNIRATLS